MPSPTPPASAHSAPASENLRKLEEKDKTLIFRLAYRHHRLFEPSSIGAFYRALREDFISATGRKDTDAWTQLERQAREWRDIFKSRDPSTEDHTELSDAARAWFEIIDKKPKVALAEEDAEDDGSDLDLMDDEDAPDEPASMPQTKSVQKWPPTRPLSTPYSPRTPSESPTRGRKRRRRCSTPRSERSIDASNERRRSSTPRRDTFSAKLLQEFIDGVNERLAAREARLDRFEESLVRRQEAMDKHFNQVMELLRSNLGGRPDPTAPAQEAPTQQPPTDA
jgi:hypothetical protein